MRNYRVIWRQEEHNKDHRLKEQVARRSPDKRRALRVSSTRTMLVRSTIRRQRTPPHPASLHGSRHTGQAL